LDPRPARVRQGAARAGGAWRPRRRRHLDLERSHARPRGTPQQRRRRDRLGGVVGSRIGRSPIAVPKGVETAVSDGSMIKVKRRKGTLEVVIDPRLEVKVENGELTVARPSDHRNDRAQHGLARSLIANAVEGVTNGFEKKLEI